MYSWRIGPAFVAGGRFQAREGLAQGQPVYALDVPSSARLGEMGARRFDVGECGAVDGHATMV